MKTPKIIRDGLAALIGTARRETDLDKLTFALGEAHGQIEAATRAREAAETAYRDGLLDATPAELESLLGAKNRMTVDLDRAEALVAALTTRITSVREAEARAARQAIHTDAVAKVDAIKGRLPAEYRHHALAIRHLLRDLCEAECARDRAHKEAAEFGFIASPEDVLRMLDGLPEEIVSTEPVELWTVVGRTDPLSPERQEEVRRSPDDPKRGTWVSSGTAHTGGASASINLEVALVPYNRVASREAVRVWRHEPLHRSVALPGFGLNDPAYVSLEPLRDHSGGLIELATDLPVNAPAHRPVRERLEIISVEPPTTREVIVPYPKREPEPNRPAGARELREAHTPSFIMAAGGTR